MYLDLSGSSQRGNPLKERIVRKMLPAKYSSNIMVNEEGRSVMVDNEVSPIASMLDVALAVVNYAGALTSLAYLYVNDLKRNKLRFH